LSQEYNNETKNGDIKLSLIAKITKQINILSKTHPLLADDNLMKEKLIFLDQPEFNIETNRKDKSRFSILLNDKFLDLNRKEMLKKSNQRSGEKKYFTNKYADGSSERLIPSPEWKKLNKITKKYKNLPLNQKDKKIKQLEKEIKNSKIMSEEELEKTMDELSERICGFGFKKSKLIRCFDDQKNDWFSNEDFYDIETPKIKMENDKLIPLLPGDLAIIKDSIDKQKGSQEIELTLSSGSDIIMSKEDLLDAMDQMEGQTLNQNFMEKCSIKKNGRP
jgi:hypothetical protein